MDPNKTSSILNGSSPEVSENGSRGAALWLGRLEGLKDLSHGWNGHAAPAPTAGAIDTARQFLTALLREGYEPTRLTASAVGGVAVTCRLGDRKVLTEFYNDGKVHALFADDATLQLHTRAVEPTVQGFGKVIEEMRAYLNA